MDFDYGLLAKYMIGELSLEEMEEVINWRNQTAGNKQIFSDLVRLRISYKFNTYNDPKRINAALEKVNGLIDRVQRFRILHVAMKYVAIVFLLCSIGYAGYEQLKPERYVTFAVNSGESVKKIMLADSTEVWLRGSSSLRIPESFSAKNRKVSLRGEAFFDVAKSISPFYISTDYINVSVLGTAFEMKVDAANKKVETTLVRGKVALLDLNWNTVLDMLPGEKVTYSQYGNQYTTEEVDVNVCAAWRLDQLVLENATLREIANQLSLKFNVNINIESSALAQRIFRCVINKGESLPDILKLLEYMAPLCYRIEGQEIFIWECKTKKE